MFQWDIVLANPSLSFQKANLSLENPSAIMLAQLKTVVLIKEVKKRAFFTLVEYLEDHNLWVRLQAQNVQKQSTFF